MFLIITNQGSPENFVKLQSQVQSSGVDFVLPLSQQEQEEEEEEQEQPLTKIYQLGVY